MADVLGQDGMYWDPLWRVAVRLTPVEQELLRCWPVRRLGFVAFAGASSMASTQSGTRLEHSLGVFALAAHFAPHDHLARAAALLHDVGHLPFSHTLEGIGGFEHHALGVAGVRGLARMLARHGLAAGDVTDVLEGKRPSILSTAPGVLKLDHLDGLVRSARSHGRSRRPPPALLDRVELVEGGVSTDAATAAELAGMVADEARLHTAPANVAADAAVRHLVGRLIDGAPADWIDQLPGFTDDELWAVLLAHPDTAAATRELRRNPMSWRVATDSDDLANAVTVVVRRLYLDLPLVGGRPSPVPHPAFTGLPTVPVSFAVVPPPPST